MGLYTAPLTPPSPNTVTITATSSTNASVTASATVNVVYPAPLLTSLSPAALPLGSGDTGVNLTGSNFVPQSTVFANGTPLVTAFSNSGQLTATLPAGMLGLPAVLNLAVSTPTPGGGLAAPLSVTVVSTGQVTATANLLVAQYSISSPRDATMSVEFGPDTNYGLRTWSQAVPTGGGQIDMLVAGMKATTT